MKKLLVFVSVLSYLGGMHLSSFAAQTEESPLHVVLVNLQTTKPDTAKSKVRQGELFNTAKDIIASRIYLSIVPADSVRKAIQCDLTKDFWLKAETGKLCIAAQRTKAEAVLFVSYQQEEHSSSICIEAVEFPSGIFIDRLSIPLDGQYAPADLQTALFAPLTSMMKMIFSQKTILGFPFQADENGLVVASANLDDEKLWKFVDRLKTNSSQTERLSREGALRVKIIALDSLEADKNTFCQQGFGWCEQAGAKVCILWSANKNNGNEKEAFIALSPTPLKKPVYETTAPFRPSLPEACCFYVPFDSISTKNIAEMAQCLIAGCKPQWSCASSDTLANFLLKEAAVLFASALHLHQNWLGSFQHDQWDSSLFILADTAYQELSVRVAEIPQFNAWVHFDRGSLLSQANRLNPAQKHFRIADSLFIRQQDSLGILLCKLEQAKMWSAQKQWAYTKTAYLSALNLLNARGDTLAVAGILDFLGMTAELQDSTQEAVTFYEDSARLYSKIGDSYKAAQLFSRLGDLFLNAGQLDKAREYFNGYLRMAKELRSEPALARANFQLGIVSLSQNRYEEALLCFRSAADYMEILGDTKGLARIDNNAGTIYVQLADFDQARLSFESALKLSQKIGDTDNKLRSLANLGDLEVQQKKWEGAHIHYDEAIELADSLNDHHEMAVITYAKGLAHLKEGRLRTGYYEIKGAMELNGGPIHGNAEKEQAFLHRLETIIGDIQEIHQEAKLD
jgi:tetratricopeptide (TPR) repeat protein